MSYSFDDLSRKANERLVREKQEEDRRREDGDRQRALVERRKERSKEIISLIDEVVNKFNAKAGASASITLIGRPGARAYRLPGTAGELLVKEEEPRTDNTEEIEGKRCGAMVRFGPLSGIAAYFVLLESDSAPSGGLWKVTVAPQHPMVPPTGPPGLGLRELNLSTLVRAGDRLVEYTDDLEGTVRFVIGEALG